MKRLLLILPLCLFTLLPLSAQHYETVEDDPMQTRIYTLDNGLKVYLSVNKEKPRIQTFIAVRTGSKNDPAETTGLAHYLEHLMFLLPRHHCSTKYRHDMNSIASSPTLNNASRSIMRLTASARSLPSTSYLTSMTN